MDLMPVLWQRIMIYHIIANIAFYSTNCIFYDMIYCHLAQIWTQPALVFPATPDCPDSVSFRQILTDVIGHLH